MKKCGYKEPCFIPGARWGHMEWELCEHLYEKDNEQGKCTGYCALDDYEIDYYNYNRYNNIVIKPRTPSNNPVVWKD